MKRAIINTFNLLLGLMAAFFSGCHSPRHIKAKPIECMYGGPVEIFEERSAKQMEQAKDTVPANDSVPTQQNDDNKQEIPVPDIPVCKYGAPGGDW